MAHPAPQTQAVACFYTLLLAQREGSPPCLSSSAPCTFLPPSHRSQPTPLRFRHPGLGRFRSGTSLPTESRAWAGPRTTQDHVLQPPSRPAGAAAAQPEGRASATRAGAEQGNPGEMPNLAGAGGASREAPGSQERELRTSREHALQQGRRQHSTLRAPAPRWWHAQEPPLQKATARGLQKKNKIGGIPSPGWADAAPRGGVRSAGTGPEGAVPWGARPGTTLEAGSSTAHGAKRLEAAGRGSSTPQRSSSARGWHSAQAKHSPVIPCDPPGTQSCQVTSHPARCGSVNGKGTQPPGGRLC